MPGPQQCGVRAVSENYTTAHGNTGCLTHWVRPGIEPATSCYSLDSFCCTTRGTPTFFNLFQNSGVVGSHTELMSHHFLNKIVLITLSFAFLFRTVLSQENVCVCVCMCMRVWEITSRITILLLLVNYPNHTFGFSASGKYWWLDKLEFLHISFICRQHNNILEKFWRIKVNLTQTTK